MPLPPIRILTPEFFAASTFCFVKKLTGQDKIFIELLAKIYYDSSAEVRFKLLKSSLLEHRLKMRLGQYFRGCLSFLLLIFPAAMATASMSASPVSCAKILLSPNIQKMAQKDLPFFFQEHEQIAKLFKAQASLRDLGITWQKFERIAHAFSKNKSLLRRINADLAHPTPVYLHNLKNYLDQGPHHSLTLPVFIQRLPAIYNLYLAALKSRINQIITELRFQAYMNSNFDTYLSSGDDEFFQAKITEKENENEDQEDKLGTLLAVSTLEVRLLFKRSNKYDWKHLVTYNARETDPDHRYILQIIQQVVETFDNDPQLNFLVLRLDDVNDLLARDAAQAKFIVRRNLSDAYFQGQNDYFGEIEIEASTFSQHPILALSNITHELEHALQRNHDFHLKPYAPSLKSTYPRGFFFSEISARIKELDYLKEQLERRLPLLKQSHHPHPSNPSSAHPELLREIKSIFTYAQSALEGGLLFAQQTKEMFVRLQDYFANPQQAQLRFTITECDDLNQIFAQSNGRFKLWSRPSPENNHHLLVKVHISKVGTFEYRLSLTTSPDYSSPLDPIFNHYLGRPSPRTIRASLQKQVERWQRSLGHLRQTLQAQEQEWQELQNLAN